MKSECSPNAKLVIIGCGNLTRRDDAAGVLAVERLNEWLRPQEGQEPCPEGSPPPYKNVEVFDAGTAGMEVMFQAKGAASVIIVDACRSGSPAGSIFKLSGSELANRPKAGFSLHDFCWDHALYAGRTILGEAFPADVSVYLIEAADTGFGPGVSSEVDRAVDEVVERLKDHIRGLGCQVQS
jgi:hydrogenase maturation protease